MSSCQLLQVDDSPLLRLALREGRFDVWEFFKDGDYPHHRAEKDEVELRVAAFARSQDSGTIADAMARYRPYLTSWVPERLREATSQDARLRLIAFADLQRIIDDSIASLHLRALDPPSPRDPVFQAHEELYRGLTRDGLLTLHAHHIPETWLGSTTAFCFGDTAVFPHPDLVPMRELLDALIGLIDNPRLRISVALDPFRFQPVAEVQCSLMEDYWSGIKLTDGNLDSLDAHDVGVSTFHAAGKQTEAQKFFNPMLGTWFDWARRGDDRTDPVKRLYVREVRPTHDRHGAELPAIKNRELHSERNTATRCFTHVDGKIARYATSTYQACSANPRGDTGSPTYARKLWRVDGPMSDAEWCELVGCHFRGNELIGEHFAQAFPAMRNP